MTDSEFKEKLEKYFEEKNLDYDEVWTENRIVCVQIDFGDWKHQHAYADYLMEQIGMKLYDEEITEEDGSDCYSSIHTYIPKNAVVEK